MTKINIVLSGIGMYHPASEIDNEYFIKHFEDLGIEVEGLMKHLGREKRYLIDNEEENSVTMAYESAKLAIEDACIEPIDIDSIIFVSDTPEYTFPSNALILNDLLDARNAHMVFDMNSNCIGMLSAVDVMSRYMLSNPQVKTVLIAGSLHVSSIARKVDTVVYPNTGDNSVAVILSKIQSDEKIGFIDSKYQTDSKYRKNIVRPACGFSKITNSDIPEDEKKLVWNPFDTSFIAYEWEKIISDMLIRNNLNVNDIDIYIFSQFSKPDAEKAMHLLGAEMGKHLFVGERYGYTGCTSPFLALHDGIKEGRVKKGDKIVLCSVGTGYNILSILYQF